MKKQVMLGLLVLVTSLVRGHEEDGSTLNKVQVIFRHGHKYPMIPKWNDDVCSRSYTPLQIGNLTEKGKVQMSLLGDYLRSRYNDFIGDESTQVEMFYSDFYRDLESGQLVNEALFRDINTTPVQMTKLEKTFEGPLLSDKTYLLEWFQSLPFKNKYQDICDRFDGKHGISCKGLFDVAFMGDQFVCQVADDCEVPEWLDSDTQTRLRQVIHDVANWMPLCSSRHFIKQHSVHLAGAINERFDPARELDYKKMHLYAMHDVNLEVLLTQMGASYSGQPNFGAALFLEQHLVKNRSVIRIYFDNTLDYTGLRQLKLTGCELDCPQEEFLRITNGPNPCYLTTGGELRTDVPEETIQEHDQNHRQEL